MGKGTVLATSIANATRDTLGCAHSTARDKLHRSAFW